MDILMLSDVYFPRVNGVSTSIRTYMRALAELGHRTVLVAPDYRGAQGDSHGQAGFDDEFAIRRLPSRVIFFDPEDRLIRGGALAPTVAELARERWDVIHVHTPFQAHRLGVKLAKATGRPTVETYHTFFEEYVAHYLPWAPAPMLRGVARWASRRLCHEVDHLIVPTEEMAGVLSGYGVRTPSTVLPTGIDLGEFSGGDGARFRRKHGIPPGRPTLVTVSRLAIEKNIPFLLRMVKQVAERIPDVLLVVAGEGPDAARLRTITAELELEGNVRFFGNLDRRTELLDCYRAADAFVFASPTETQGLVLIEAMALGVPIVSTAVMGTRTVLRDAKSAVVAPEDEAAFAQHVVDLLQAPDRREALSHHGPRDAEAWSTVALMRQAEALYARLADGAASTPTVTSPSGVRRAA